MKITSSIFALFLVVSLMGCTTPPVIPKFPEAPIKAGAMEKCSELKKLQNDSKLSDIARVIADNYGMYHDCAFKTEIWIEWYNTNKQNYDKIGK